jgi:predicted DNA-binding transcriptional regulator AlpA
MSTETTDLLTLAEIAPLLGVTFKSATAYHHTAQRNRRESKPRATDMPAPDHLFGRTPVWDRATILAWMEARTPRPPRPEPATERQTT